MEKGGKNENGRAASFEGASSCHTVSYIFLALC